MTRIAIAATMMRPREITPPSVSVGTRKVQSERCWHGHNEQGAERPECPDGIESERAKNQSDEEGESQRGNDGRFHWLDRSRTGRVAQSRLLEFRQPAQILGLTPGIAISSYRSRGRPSQDRQKPTGCWRDLRLGMKNCPACRRGATAGNDQPIPLRLAGLFRAAVQSISMFPRLPYVLIGLLIGVFAGRAFRVCTALGCHERISRQNHRRRKEMRGLRHPVRFTLAGARFR